MLRQCADRPVGGGLFDGETEIVALVDGPRIVEQHSTVLADDWFLVVAGDVVECDAVVVYAVEDAEAGLGGLVDAELGVVRLRLLQMTSRGPWLLTPACGERAQTTVTQLTRRRHSGDSQTTLRRHSGDIQVTLRRHSGDIQVTIRRQSGALR